MSTSHVRFAGGRAVTLSVALLVAAAVSAQAQDCDLLLKGGHVIDARNRISVIARSTWNPAREIKQEQLGHLSVGAIADVAVLRLEKGQFGYADQHGARLSGNERLSAEMTLKDGKVSTTSTACPGTTGRPFPLAPTRRETCAGMPMPRRAAAGARIGGISSTPSPGLASAN